MKTLPHLASLQPFIPRLLPQRTASYWEEVWHPLKMQLPSDPWPNSLLHAPFSTQWFWFNFSLCTVAIKSHFHHRTCCLPSWPSLIYSVRLLSLIAGNLTDFKLQARLSNIWIHHHLTHVPVRPNMSVLRTPVSAAAAPFHPSWFSPSVTFHTLDRQTFVVDPRISGNLQRTTRRSVWTSLSGARVRGRYCHFMVGTFLIWTSVVDFSKVVLVK